MRLTVLVLRRVCVMHCASDGSAAVVCVAGLDWY